MSIARFTLVLIAVCELASSASGQLIAGHRGASYDAPENTMASFKLALEQGADAIESDFWLGAGGHIMCLHDKDTERVAGKKLVVTKAPFEKLRALDIGSWKDPKWRSERMPTLDEVLAIVPAGKKFFIELKSSTELVKPMAKAIAASHLLPDQIVLISFHAEAIAECKKQMPQYKALWLCGFEKKKDGTPPPSVEEVAATLKRIHADGLDGQGIPEYVNETFLKRLKELGCREFSVWTLDDPKIAQFYARLGAWSITTNRPGWLRKELGQE
jgi:glycerophosphoryl diester phosphodiesterase